VRFGVHLEVGKSFVGNASDLV
jgi:hypothetical protein